MFNKLISFLNSTPDALPQAGSNLQKNFLVDTQSSNFLSLAKQRRTIYALGKNLPVSSNAVISTIKEAVREAPSAFNSQSSRIVILLGEEHSRFWEIVRAQLRKIVPEDSFMSTSIKIDGFAAAAGSVLFYEDQEVVSSLQKQFAAYADNFPIWSEHSSAIAQYAVWMALTEQGLGANLQHYNPLIDNEVQKEWNIPSHWKLRAHLNFGQVLAYADTQTYIDDNERFIIAK